ncbi:MAG: ATP-binding protein [Myxococcales bacterium]|nr:ATP-binding protein [Myxococcales bacterium]MDH5307387.1 ATP-binding protein [Myxococcales bacterium]MDH5565613.1 ATP-binding protein [Myxococcales bacterium]
MKRIRITLLLVSLALVVPTAVLTWRALDGLAFERAARHRAVADRTFEEMERVLSRFLEREEARSFEQYRFYMGDSAERSPLARISSEPFVVGAFQIDPDGSVHTPLQPRDVALARARGDWPPSERVGQVIAIVLGVARAAWPAALGPEAANAPEPARPARQRPGTTQAIDATPGAESVAPLEPEALEKQEGATAYEVLRSLDRAAESRAERKQKTASAPPSLLHDTADSRDSRDEAGRPGEEPLGAAGIVAREQDAPAAPPRVSVTARAFDPEGPPVLITLDPMTGRAEGAHHLLLVRTVLVDRQGYRQGLVLDRQRLGDWLRDEVIAASGLLQIADVSFYATGSAASPKPDPDRFVFEHRFAEPFDAVTARLQLPLLPGVGRPWAVYALAVLLASLGAGGVFAIHRMVSVVFDFAERRNSFAAAVTHELKTPLTAIRMYAEMLRDGLIDSDTRKREYYATITEESERLTRLVDNVLEFSRLERGGREMSLQVGPVGPILEEAAERLRAEAGRQGFSIEVHVEDELPAVCFDRDALLQVLLNLIDNAMKYSSSACERSITLEARQIGEEIGVCVRDHGPGVPSHQQRKIFDPFYRAADERTRSVAGTGIGLALVKELCSRMGAAVTAANADGGGLRVCAAFRAAAQGSRTRTP